MTANAKFCDKSIAGKEIIDITKIDRNNNSKNLLQILHAVPHMEFIVLIGVQTVETNSFETIHFRPLDLTPRHLRPAQLRPHFYETTTFETTVI